MRNLVKKYFTKSVNKLFGERYPDLKQLILNSERREILIDNLTNQMRIVEKKRKVLLTRKKIQGLVEDYVKLFGQAVILEKENALRTPEKKSQIWLPPKKAVSNVLDFKMPDITKIPIIHVSDKDSAKVNEMLDNRGR